MSLVNRFVVGDGGLSVTVCVGAVNEVVVQNNVGKNKKGLMGCQHFEKNRNRTVLSELVFVSLS